MKLADLLKPEDGGKDNTQSLRKLVRQKSFKAMVNSLAKKNNPSDGTLDPEQLGDGGRDEPLGGSSTNTVDLL